MSFAETDLAAAPEAALDGSPDLVTAAALFDLASRPWIGRLARSVAGKRAAFYTALTYNGDDSWAPPHPEIRDILAETYGIMVYQEQVMQIAQLMAGFSLASADLLRRAMGKKIRAEMDAQRQAFTEGAVGRGIEAAKATEVFDLMAKFADYGFNKSHAAAYALVAYQTAWLKANHPAAFLAASMSLALANTDKLAALRQEAERMGIKVLPPCVNKSGADFTVEALPGGGQAIRYALAAVKKVGLAAMQSLVASRGDAPFRDAADMAAFNARMNMHNNAANDMLAAAASDDHYASASSDSGASECSFPVTPPDTQSDMFEDLNFADYVDPSAVTMGADVFDFSSGSASSSWRADTPPTSPPVDYSSPLDSLSFQGPYDPTEGELRSDLMSYLQVS